MFSEIAKIYGTNYPDSKWLADYRAGLTEEVIASIYITHKNTFHAMCRTYNKLDDSTKESLILEQIWKVLENYDETKNAKISSVICGYLKNALNRAMRDLTTKKRRGEAIPMSQLIEDGDRPIEEVDEEHGYCSVEIDSLVEHTSHLTENEREYCRIAINEGCDLSAAAIGRELQVSKTAAYNIKRSLQVKLHFILN